jgi:hypothetical protein
MSSSRSQVGRWLLLHCALASAHAGAATVDPAWLVSLGVTLAGNPRSVSTSALAIDSRGDSVIVATTKTPPFPGIDSSRTTNGGAGLRFVARLDATGAPRIVTVVGSPGLDGVTRNNDRVTGLALDASDNAYVVAFDVAHDVPLGGTYRPPLPRPFVYRVSPSGQVARFALPLDPAIRSVNALGVDGAGNVIVVGSADAGLATTPGVAYATSAVAPTCIAPYALKLTPGGPAPAYATYLAYAGTQGETCGREFDGVSPLEPAAYAVAVDASGNAAITGQAEPGARASGGGVDLAPVVATLHDNGRWAASHAFVTRLAANGAALWSARLGGAVVDRGTSVLFDASGNVFVGGKTTSNRSFPSAAVTLFAPFQLYGCSLNTPEFGFLAKLAPDGRRLAWSGLLPADGSNIDDCGGSTPPQPVVLAGNARGGVFASGFASSNHSASMSRINPMADDGDAFFAEIDGNGAVVYSTWMTLRAVVRGIGVDTDGNVRVAGGAFVRQLSPARLPIVVAPRVQPVCAGATFDVDARVAAAGNVGTVDFTIDGAAAGTSSVRGGLATVTTTLAVGVHRIQARYRGATAFDGATSTVAYLAVHQAGLC